MPSAPKSLKFALFIFQQRRLLHSTLQSVLSTFPNFLYGNQQQCNMKASIKFRDDQKPLLRAKVPLSVLNFPFQSGVTAGDSKELSLNLSTFFDSGPSIKFSYRPNDSLNPFSLIFKTGIGNFGSPIKSPLTMSAEFNFIGSQNPTFSIHFKPDFGDFSLKKSQSSGLGKNFGEKLGVVGDEGFVNNGYFKRAAFFPATVESKAAAGIVVSRLVKGMELSARTAMPLRDLAVVSCRWGLRFPPPEVSPADEMDAVMVGKSGDQTARGIRLPLLVMNKIGIEHVPKSNSKREKSGADDNNLGKVCMEVQKQLEAIQAENGLLSKALSDLRSDISSGKMDFSFNGIDKKYPLAADRRSSGDKKSLEVMTSVKEGNNGSKPA